MKGRCLKTYNVIKGGKVVFANITVPEIISKLDISQHSIRESDWENKPMRGYYFVGNKEETKSVIPKQLLDEWDTVTSRFRGNRKVKLIISKMQIVKKAGEEE